MLTALCAHADDQPVADSVELKKLIQQQQQQRATTARQLSLQQGAAKITAEQVQQLQQQLEQARKKLATEQQEVTRLENDTATLDAQIAEYQKVLPQHEAADALVGIADAAAGRLAELQQSAAALQEQLATLRKSAVEWRSKVSESEQRIAALVAARPELQKKRDEAAAARDKAEQTITEARKVATASMAAATAAELTLNQTRERQQQAAKSSEQIAAAVKSLQTSVQMLQKAAEASGVDSTTAISTLQKAIADFAPVTAQNTELTRSLAARVDEYATQLTAAQEKLKQDSAAVAARDQEAAPLREAFTTAAAAMDASIAEETTLTKTVAEGKSWQDTLNAQLLALSPSLDKLRAETAIVTAESTEYRRQAQEALEPLGRFVSFSRDVAPILASRCVACHNTRSPGGRLNLDSYAALLKGGESGESFTPGHSADSLLLSMIEDGSMPKEAAALEADQIAVLKRWINAGAPLDAGMAESSDLFDLMPELAQPLPPREYSTPIPVTAVAFSPDGSELATSGYHEVLVWSTADGALLRRITNVAERVYDVEYSADGTQLAVAAGTPGELGELKLFSVADGTLLRTLVRSRDAIFALSFSPDHSRIACCGADRSISVANLQSGEILLHVEDHADWVLDVNWSPDGQKLISGSRDKTSKVFNAADGSPVVTFSGHGQPVYTAVFLSDSMTAATGGGDKRVRIWTSADGKEVRGIGGFGGDVFRIQRLPEDQLLSASGDGKLHLHKSADGAAVRQYAGHSDWVYTVSSHTARGLVASGCYDGEVRIWNAADGSSVTAFPAIPKDKAVATAQTSDAVTPASN